MRFNLQFRYQSSDNKYILTSFCRRPSQSCLFLSFSFVGTRLDWEKSLIHTTSEHFWYGILFVVI